MAVRPERAVLAFIAAATMACEEARASQPTPTATAPPLEIITKDRIDYSYKVGQVVSIYDPDTQTSGYLLRPAATTQLWELHPNLAAVFDGDWVELKEVQTMGQKKMWRVEVTAVGVKSWELLGGQNYRQEGWLNQQALGEEVIR